MKFTIEVDSVEAFEELTGLTIPDDDANEAFLDTAFSVAEKMYETFDGEELCHGVLLEAVTDLFVLSVADVPTEHRGEVCASMILKIMDKIACFEEDEEADRKEKLAK